jgi:hypothetical protein
VSDEQADSVASLINGALCSLEGEAPWTVVWGKLPDGVQMSDLRVTFRNGRRTQPVARMEVVGRHWAGEVAGRFDKVEVSYGGEKRRRPETAKVSERQKEPAPSRRRPWRRRPGQPAAVVADPLAQMKTHWGLAGLILQPGSVELSELPDIRISGRES